MKPTTLFLHMRLTRQQRNLINAMVRSQGTNITIEVMKAVNERAERIGLLKPLKERKASNG